MRISTAAEQYDIVVVGGGLVGASFAAAIALHSPELSVLVVEAAPPGGSNPQPSFDARSTALSFGSRKFFEGIELWDELQPRLTPIQQIHVSDQGRFGSTLLNHREHHLEALGYVAENRDLGELLSARLQAVESIGLLAPARIASIRPRVDGMELDLLAGDEQAPATVHARLVVLADGGRSPLCGQLGIQQDSQAYEQQALIANIGFTKPHNNVAYERFTTSGPVAVLPLAPFEGQNRGALVWTLGADEAVEVAGLSEAQLLERLQRCLGNRLGRLTQIGERFCYPLALSVAREQIRPGLVLLGNVAHTLHPVAGQGLNLALRDTEALVGELTGAAAAGHSPGEMAVLQRYLERQEFDQRKSITFTDQMIRLFSTDATARVMARKFGVLAIDLLPSVRRGFARQAMGFEV